MEKTAHPDAYTPVYVASISFLQGVEIIGPEQLDEHLTGLEGKRLSGINSGIRPADYPQDTQGSIAFYHGERDKLLAKIAIGRAGDETYEEGGLTTHIQHLIPDQVDTVLEILGLDAANLLTLSPLYTYSQLPAEPSTPSPIKNFLHRLGFRQP